MFNFSSPEMQLQMLQDARRAVSDGGPGVVDKPLDEQSIKDLRNSLAYTFSVARTAQAEYGDEVGALAKAEYDQVWLHLIEEDKGFRKRVLSSHVQAPIGSLKPYQDYLKGKSSEL